jgi:hypothetical protein
MARKRVRPVRLRALRASKSGRPGRPPVHQETWSKVSVVLFDRQIVHLDRLAVDIRGKSGKVLNRAEIIRALIDGLLDSGMDITGSASEADLRARVARRLGSPYR